MSEYEIKTAKDKRAIVIELLHPLGVVTEKFADGTFNFRCYDEQCEDEMREILEDIEVECVLL